MFIELSNPKFFIKICTRRDWTAGECLDEIRRIIINGQGSGAGCYKGEYHGHGGIYADKFEEVRPERVKVENAETGETFETDADKIPAGCKILSTVRAAVYRFIEDERITREIVEERRARA